MIYMNEYEYEQYEGLTIEKQVKSPKSSDYTSPVKCMSYYKCYIGPLEFNPLIMCLHFASYPAGFQVKHKV